MIVFGTFFAGYVFTTWLGIGQRLALLNLVRHESDVVERALRAGRYLLATLLTAMTLVILAGLVIALAVPAAAMTVALLNLDTRFIPQLLAGDLTVIGAGLVVLATRLSRFAYVIVERNVGVVESLSSSWKMTRSHVTTLMPGFGLWLLINLGGILACLVGCLITAPFASLMLAVTYLSLARMGEPDSTKTCA